MPAVETVTIINKSGKIVSTGRQLVNIFKDAKAAYNERKTELKLEYKHYARHHGQARIELRSATSDRSQRTHHSNRSHRPKHRKSNDTSRPPLTARNLSYLTEESLSDVSRYSTHKSDYRSYRSTSPNQNYIHHSETITDSRHPYLHRRHTASPNTYLTTVASTHPPPYTSRISRSQSNPDFSKDSKIDMNLAYGHPPFDIKHESSPNSSPEYELQETVGKLDNLLLEARCLQHSATAIIAHLQKDPEAMAAVALTLAELSTIVSKMGPSILRTLQTVSPAIFALLASPQFLIATGVAMGATVIMFGGFHIIKKIQSNAEHKREAKMLESPMVYSGIDIESIKSWRRGVAESEIISLQSSADEEYITPEAARQQREHLRNRALVRYKKVESVYSDTTKHNSSRAHSSRTAPSEASGRSRRTSSKAGSTISACETEKSKKKKGKEKDKDKDKGKSKKKKSSILSTLFEMKK